MASVLVGLVFIFGVVAVLGVIANMSLVAAKAGKRAATNARKGAASKEEMRYIDAEFRTSSRSKPVTMVLGTLAFFSACLVVEVIGRMLLTLMGIYDKSPIPGIRLLDQVFSVIIFVVAVGLGVLAFRRIYRDRTHNAKRQEEARHEANQHEISERHETQPRLNQQAEEMVRETRHRKKSTTYARPASPPVIVRVMTQHETETDSITRRAASFNEAMNEIEADRDGDKEW